MTVYVYDKTHRPLKPVPIEAVEQSGGKLVDPRHPSRVFHPQGEGVWWFKSEDAAYRAAIARKRRYIAWAEHMIADAKEEIAALEEQWGRTATQR